MKKMQAFAALLAFVALSSARPGIRPIDNSLIIQDLISGINSKDYPFGNQESLTQDDSSVLKPSIDLWDTKIEKNATPSDLKIYLYTRRNKDNPVVIRSNDIGALVNSGFYSSSARTISITHGWMNDYSSEINTLLTDAILGSYDFNVLVSDWGSVAYKNYFTAKSAIPSLGTYLGSVIDAIVKTYGISHQQFTLIGHSLGAHISGAAGSATEQKVDLIIGLDAAQPFFTINNVDERLDPSDANFVQAIHTAAGFLGFTIAIGHSDYYPNGGNTQNGCSIDLSCSHGRSYKYLVESISNSKQKFWSYKCDNYKTFKGGACTNKENQSFMGTLEPDRNARGSYYLNTNSKSPYAIDINPIQNSSL